MKELEVNIKDKVQIASQKQIESKVVIIGTLKPKENHRLYSMDKATGVIEEVIKELEFEKEVHWFDAIKNNFKFKYKKVKFDNDKIYCTALNLKNAGKRFKTMSLKQETFKS